MDSFCNALKNSGRETKRKTNFYEWNWNEYECKILRKAKYPAKHLHFNFQTGNNNNNRNEHGMSKQKLKRIKRINEKSWKTIEQKCYK